MFAKNSDEMKKQLDSLYGIFADSSTGLLFMMIMVVLITLFILYNYKPEIFNKFKHFASSLPQKNG